MIVRLLAPQISIYWEAIKYALTQMPFFREASRRKLFNIYLANLLADKMQCWFIIDEERKLKSIIITSLVNELDELEIHLNAAYGYLPANFSDAREFFETMMRWARNIGAKRIIGDVVPRQLDRVFEEAGYRLDSKVYVKEVG
ncbi:MAG: hypothetical protein DDT19_01897 [Syntrophomonadaceae bacterium]|nr:hypothetical protein [Bacillota bacterium]